MGGRTSNSPPSSLLSLFSDGSKSLVEDFRIHRWLGSKSTHHLFYLFSSSLSHSRFVNPVNGASSSWTSRQLIVDDLEFCCTRRISRDRGAQQVGVPSTVDVARVVRTRGFVGRMRRVKPRPWLAMGKPGSWSQSRSMESESLYRGRDLEISFYFL